MEPPDRLSIEPADVAADDGAVTEETVSPDAMAPAGEGQLPPGVIPAERMIFFSDAVVAIAQTLLILPLMESVPELVHQHDASVSAWLHEQSKALLAFVMSFVVITAFWATHHRIMTPVERTDRALGQLNSLWLFTIVWLPVATQLVSGLPVGRLQAVFYVGAMLANSALLALMARHVDRRPYLSRGAGAGQPRVHGIAVAAALFGVGLLITLVFPRTDYMGLAVVMLATPVTRWLNRRRPAPAPAAG